RITLEMHHHPTPATFRDLAKGHTLVPVYRQLTGDTLTPVTAFCKVQEGDWAFLFESVVGGERMGRYSFVGAGPFLRFLAFGNKVQIDTPRPDGQPGGWITQQLEHPDPLRLLEEYLARYHAPSLPG